MQQQKHNFKPAASVHSNTEQTVKWSSTSRGKSGGNREHQASHVHKHRISMAVAPAFDGQDVI